jgi:hypothetical protein
MPDSMTPRTELRRDVDGRVVFDPVIWNPRLKMAAGLIGFLALLGSILGGLVVRPAQLKVVADSVGVIADVQRSQQSEQEATTQAVVRLNVRVDSLAYQTGLIQQAVEVIAIDVCNRNRNNPISQLLRSCRRLLSP